MSVLEKTKRLVILGDSLFAEIAHQYFTHDSEYEVVGFSVERAHRDREELFGLPIVPFEEISDHFNPTETSFYAAIVYSQLNRLRTRLYRAAKSRGYSPASYISSRAFVWGNAKIGEHCFVFEDNTIQPFVTIADNVVLWSGNHLGHHCHVGENCFISSHVVISGSSSIGANSFVGVNASIGNDVSIGTDNWIGAGVTILHDTAANLIFKGEQPEPAKVSATRFFRVPPE